MINFWVKKGVQVMIFVKKVKDTAPSPLWLPLAADYRLYSNVQIIYNFIFIRIWCLGAKPTSDIGPSQDQDIEGSVRLAEKFWSWISKKSGEIVLKLLVEMERGWEMLESICVRGWLDLAEDYKRLVWCSFRSIYYRKWNIFVLQNMQNMTIFLTNC